MANSKKMQSMKINRIIDTIWSNALVFLLAALWIVPIVWIVVISFSDQAGFLSQSKGATFNNYIELFTETEFLTWVLNTLLLAVINTVLTTLFTVVTAFALSRFRFKTRKLFINITLVLGMFPGFMSMIAVIIIFDMLDLIDNIWALLVYYVAGAGLGFFVCKGYFDTIPKDIDEAIHMDGASQLTAFVRVYLPLIMPIIIYTALMAFMAPWADYILAGKLLVSPENKTVAVGLYEWMDTSINTHFTKFAAGSVIVAIPITALYISLQRFFVEGISAGAVKG